MVVQTEMTTTQTLGQKGEMENYFASELFCIKLFGYSLTGNESKLYRIYSFLYFFSTVAYLLCHVYELTKHEMEAVFELLITITGITLSLGKGFVVHLHRIKFGKLLGKIQQDPFLPNLKRGGDDEAKILAECLWLTKIQTRVYYSVAVLTVTGNVSYTVFKRLTSSDYHDWLFPYGPFTVLDVTHSPNYEIWSFYENISIMFCGGSFVLVDLLLASILAHICYQFKILQNYIRQLVTISRNDMAKKTTGNTCSNSDASNSIVPWGFLKTHLARAVDYHVAIIDLTSEVESLFSNMLLFTFMGTLTMLCLAIFAATTATNQDNLATQLGVGAACSFQVLIICYWGEQVSHESDMVGRAAFESNFVGTDARFQKALALVIRKSQRTSKLTAGKFIVVALVTFSWILRTSYSSFMVLRKANSPRT